MNRLLIITIAALCGCHTEQEDDPVPGLRLFEPGVGVALTTTYETSSLDLFAVGAPTDVRKDVVVASGDAALRLLGHRAVILNRGDASNLMLVSSSVTVEAQLALPGCGPHDVVELADGRLLLTCYEDDATRLVNLETMTVAPGPSLAVFSDADGLPEMDQLLVIGNRIYVSLQNLDRATYAPTGPGLVAVITLDTLEVVDVKPGIDGVQAWTLPRKNPYTPLIPLNDGRLAVGCAGDMLDLDAMGIVALNPIDGSTEVLWAGSALNGAPSALRADPSGTLHALVIYPDGWTAEEMRLLRLDAATPKVIYSAPGFNLSGLAFDELGRAYVGNRTTDATNGVWRIDPATLTAEGPFVTGLPPLELEIVR
jgi:hypothetical protein